MKDSVYQRVPLHAAKMQLWSLYYVYVYSSASSFVSVSFPHTPIFLLVLLLL